MLPYPFANSFFSLNPKTSMLRCPFIHLDVAFSFSSLTRFASSSLLHDLTLPVLSPQAQAPNGKTPSRAGTGPRT